jgi:5'-phosphate synthase pdxT subunit
MKVGVLALQGAFIEHEKMLEDLGVESIELRQESDCDKDFDALVLPGGESTVMGKLLKELNMFDKIRNMIKSGMPVFGTCAGLLLLAGNIENDKRSHLALMDITAERNAYGRQLGSFETTAEFKGIGEIPMRFIRAPYIKQADDKVDVLAVVDGRIVAARENNMLVTAFHPELTESTAVHKYFIENVVGLKA